MASQILAAQLFFLFHYCICLSRVTVVAPRSTCPVGDIIGHCSDTGSRACCVRDTWQQREARIAASLEPPASPLQVLASLPVSIPSPPPSPAATASSSGAAVARRVSTRTSTKHATWGADGIEDVSDHGWGSDVSSDDSTIFVPAPDAGMPRRDVYLWGNVCQYVHVHV
jgi:hypothetical protein